MNDKTNSELVELIAQLENKIDNLATVVNALNHRIALLTDWPMVRSVPVERMQKAKQPYAK